MGVLSPSAKNLQERRFIVIKDANTRKLLCEAASNQKFVAEAPVVIAACSVENEYIMPCGQLAYPIDTAIAVDHMTLQAVEEGLGTCWIGAFDEKRRKTGYHRRERIYQNGTPCRPYFALRSMV